MPNEHEQLVDELLVMDWQEGRGEALEQLVRRWQRRLWRHALRMTGDAEGASDVVQNAWIGMIRGIGRLEDPKRFRYWAYRIVTNKACDWVRGKGRRREESLMYDEAVVDRRRDGRESLEDHEEMLWLLDGLSVDHRAVVSLFYVEGLSVERIGQALDLAKGTVKSRLHYARQLMKRRLESRPKGSRGDGLEETPSARDQERRIS